MGTYSTDSTDSTDSTYSADSADSADSIKSDNSNDSLNSTSSNELPDQDFHHSADSLDQDSNPSQGLDYSLKIWALSNFQARKI